MPVPARSTSKIATWTREPFVISTDPKRIDLDVVHGFLVRSYWATGISRELVALSLENSLPFGIYQGARQVGGARVITDCATFAYLDDVFVIEEFRGHGLGKWLMECVTNHPDLQGLRYFHLRTDDAHGLYAQYGFAGVLHPEWSMEIAPNDLYLRQSNMGKG